MPGSTMAERVCCFPPLSLSPRRPCWKPTRALRETDHPGGPLLLFVPVTSESRWPTVANYRSQRPLRLARFSQWEPPLGGLEDTVMGDAKFRCWTPVTPPPPLVSPGFPLLLISKLCPMPVCPRSPSNVFVTNDLYEILSLELPDWMVLSSRLETDRQMFRV